MPSDLPTFTRLFPLCISLHLFSPSLSLTCRHLDVLYLLRQGRGYHGGDEDAELRDQIRELGLRVKEVAADGNCFFRAMCDQRWGNEHDHLALRRHTIQYMQANRDNFEPFIEDDEKWDAYIERMSEDGTWAGNMELQAASLVCMANICVHQAGQPRWEIVNYKADRWFHVTYEGSEHYNSVRLANRYYEDDEPGGPISLIRGRGGVAVPLSLIHI